MLFTIQELTQITKAKLLSEAYHAEIKYILTDSRHFSKPVNTAFIAIKGLNNDGHKYIEQVFQTGVKTFIIDNIVFFNRLNADIKKKSTFLLCENAVTALQNIAAFHRNLFSIPVAAVTGSNGKTTVKDWIQQLGQDQRRIKISPKSYNSQVGVPLSVLTLNDNDEIAVFEAGISLPDEMSLLQNIIKPDIGVFTNIGPAHQEGFMSIQHKLDEKLLLFQNVKLLIYCDDYELIVNTIRRNYENGFFNKNISFLKWSVLKESDLTIFEQNILENRREFSFKWKDSYYKAEIPFSDDASFENAINSLLFLLSAGFQIEPILAKMASLSAVEMRMEIKEGMNSCIIINDSYNSDLYSLAIALDHLESHAKTKKKTVILSDILQSGTIESELYAKVAQFIKDHQIAKFIGIGKGLMKYSGYFTAENMFFDDTASFLKILDTESFDNEVILIKGARKFNFEKIAVSLQKKVHSTILEINLNHLVHNLNCYRTLCHPDTKIMVMVKAFGYGSGNLEISKTLQYHQVDYLGVAYADEGIELRNAGINIPIMVMNPDVNSLSTIIKAELEPEIYSFRLLNSLIEIYEKSINSGRIKIHLKFDTGMHRLGFAIEDVSKIIDIISEHTFIEVASVFSHLAATENSTHDAFTNHQINQFEQIKSALKTGLKSDFICHLLNSSGIIRFSKAHYNMVRLGIGLYGIDTTSLLCDQLKNVVTFKTTISQIKDVKTGETIGYSRAGVAQHDMKVATVGVGYADGFSRKLGNGAGKMSINGSMVQTIGNICMDMCMVDITGIEAKEGDEVIIFDDQYSIMEIAQQLDTIPYEVLTSISQRVKRIYYNE